MNKLQPKLKNPNKPTSIQSSITKQTEKKKKRNRLKNDKENQFSHIADQLAALKFIPKAQTTTIYQLNNNLNWQKTTTSNNQSSNNSHIKKNGILAHHLQQPLEGQHCLVLWQMVPGH